MFCVNEFHKRSKSRPLNRLLSLISTCSTISYFYYNTLQNRLLLGLLLGRCWLKLPPMPFVPRGGWLNHGYIMSIHDVQGLPPLRGPKIIIVMLCRQNFQAPSALVLINFSISCASVSTLLDSNATFIKGHLTEGGSRSIHQPHVQPGSACAGWAVVPAGQSATFSRPAWRPMQALWWALDCMTDGHMAKARGDRSTFM